MENSNEIKNSDNQQDEKIQIYENDDAYLFGEDISGSGDVILKENLNNNKNNVKINNYNQDELLNKFNTNSSREEEQEYNKETKNNNNNNDNNINEINNSLTDKKYMINDINSDLEDQEENNNNENNNNNIKNENNINNYNENEINNNNLENESNDSELPLVTLNFLSICQCCKNSFNSNENIPYLLKCGHFFCKQCIIKQFTD